MAALLAPCPFRGVKAFCNVKKSPSQWPRRGFVAIHAVSIIKLISCSGGVRVLIPYESAGMHPPKKCAGVCRRLLHQT